MSDSFLKTFKLHQRLRGKISVQIKEASADLQKASEFFGLIITQLASCNEQNCEPETIYKNTVAIGDYWGLGAEDFKDRVSESELATNSENWFVRAFVGGAKVSRVKNDFRTQTEKELDLVKLKKLAGFDDEVIEKIPKSRRLKIPNSSRTASRSVVRASCTGKVKSKFARVKSRKKVESVKMNTSKKANS